MYPEYKVFFLDMDGVVADFVGSVLKLYNMTYVPENWPIGDYKIEPVLGINYDEMWAKIDKTPNFWENLESLENGLLLYNKLCKLGEVYFATSPSRHSNSSSGKVNWLQSRFGESFRNYVLGPNKHLLAGNGILIDDDDNKVNKFREAGGLACLYPQPWNKEHENRHRQVEFVMDYIDSLHTSRVWTATA